MNTIAIHRSPEAAMPTADERIITARFKNPARSATVCIPADPFTALASVPDAYRGLLDAILEKAARDILSAYLNGFTQWPTTIPADRFTHDALLECANGANSNWLSKEELEAAWKASATRKAFCGDARFSANPAYRKAVAKFEELILKMAAKNAAYQPEELDKILAKLHDDDLNGEFGLFVVRRIEQIRNKPAAATIDLDVL